MKQLSFVFALLIIGCSSAPKPQVGILAPQCAATSVQENDLKQFGLKPEPGKIVVLRVFATWCPFCKLDLSRMGEHFRSKEWSPGKVKIFLLAYHTHGENRDTAEAFQRDDLKMFGIPREAVQMVYVDQEYDALKTARGASTAPLFTGWQGLPFALIFGKDGRLAFRGHFTQSAVDENRNYEFITKLQDESCGSHG